MTAADCPSEILRFSAREEIEKGGEYDFVASFSVNEFRGSRKSQLILTGITRQGETNWEKKLETGYLRRFPAEAAAYAAYCRAPQGKALTTPEQLEEWRDKNAGALGTAVFSASQPGARILKSFQERWNIPWAEAERAEPDSAESCLCYLQRGPLQNFAHTLAIGAFSALAENPGAAVYLGENLREAYRAEAKAFYDPELFPEFAAVFAELRGVYGTVSEFLAKAAGILGLPDLKKPWLAFQVFFEQKLLEVRKSDKIIHIQLKEEAASVPEQSVYFRAMRDLSDGKV